jgi:hypothetical protein
VEWSPTWGANTHSGSQEISRLLWKPKVHYRAHKNSTVRWIQYTLSHHIFLKSVNLSLCFYWAQRHENVMGEWNHCSMHSSTSALDGDKWSALHSGRFPRRERASGRHWIGGWVGPSASLDAVVKRFPSSRRESNPRTPIVQPVAYSQYRLSYHGSW